MEELMLLSDAWRCLVARLATASTPGRNGTAPDRGATGRTNERPAGRAWTALTRARQVGRTAVFAFLAVGVMVSPARAGAALDLSGEWLDSTYTLSAYRLHMSADRKTVSATWGADIGNLHEGLVGSFIGTLNQAGTAFAGLMHVRAGSLLIKGTMTVAVTSQQEFGYPLLAVSYEQDNGVEGSFTLEIWVLPPKVSASSSRAATFEFDCPAQKNCRGGAEAQALGSPSGGNVGSVRFTVEPGHIRMIRLSLNKTGRSLLAKRGSLRVRVLVFAPKQSSTLPPLTNLGTVTFHVK